MLKERYHRELAKVITKAKATASMACPCENHMILLTTW